MPWTYRFPIEWHEAGTDYVQLDVVVSGSSLDGFVHAMDGLRSGTVSYVVLKAPGGTLSVELRHDRNLRFVPPQPIGTRKGISRVEKSGPLVRVVLNDLDVQNVFHYYNDWLVHGLPETPAVECEAWFGSKRCVMRFTHDARRDRGQAPVVPGSTRRGTR